MKFSLLTIIVIITVIAIINFFLSKPSLETINIDIGNQSFSLEIAKTLAQKSGGLSKRKTLCDTCGMIFVYQKEWIYPFWMKDTLVPLDIIWVNKDYIVVDIIQGKPNDLKILKPKDISQYIIELNANMAQNLNLKIGDKIKIPQNL